MSSDAEILAPGGRLGEARPDPRRWAALVVMLLAGFAFLLMLALPARRGHSGGAAAV
jgi:hypothetical protein